jgi:hypothetical protein
MENGYLAPLNKYIPFSDQLSMSHVSSLGVTNPERAEINT